MALVSLYVPSGVPDAFLKRLRDHITLVASPADPYALFARTDACACSTPHGLAIRDRTLLVVRGKHQALGYPLYALPADCTLEETVVVVAWLFRNKFKTFQTTLREDSLQRTLGSDGFRKTAHGRCCDQFTLEEDPVFMLKPIVVSAYAQGPTLDSVLKKPSP